MVRESLLSIYNNQTSILNEFTAKLMDTQNKASLPDGYISILDCMRLALRA